jgi:hypothetical protein
VLEVQAALDLGLLPSDLFCREPLRLLAEEVLTTIQKSLYFDFNEEGRMSRKRSRWIWTRIARFGLLSTIYYLLPAVSMAQITFERTYGGTDFDSGYSVQQTSDGGYIITGYTSSFGAGMNDVWLLKTDSLGDTLWTRTYGGAGGSESGQFVEQTLDGGFIIVGNNGWLLKTNAGGDTLWTRKCCGAGLKSANSGQQTQDGGYIIVGATRLDLLDDNDVLLIKTNAFGDSLWAKIYDMANENDKGYSVQQTTDGGYIITGYTVPSVLTVFDVLLLKTDAFGNTLWTRSYGDGDTLNEVGHSVQQTTDGGYIIAGYTFSFSAGMRDVWLLKTDSGGDTLWTRTYGGIDNDIGYSVQQTSDGGYIIAGSTQSFGVNVGTSNVWLIRTDDSGDTLWTRTYGGNDGDGGLSVQQTVPDGGYVITGFTQSFSAGIPFDVYLIKTDGNGLVVGIEEENPEFRISNFEFRLLQNNPNPFHNSTLIRYTIPGVRGQGSGVGGNTKVPVRLTVYDITGRLVETLVDKSQESGVYDVKWEGKDQVSGIYFYRLQSGDFTTTKKIILLK